MAGIKGTVWYMIAPGRGGDRTEDELLSAKLEQYSGWMRERRIPHAYRVLPIGKAFSEYVGALDWSLCEDVDYV